MRFSRSKTADCQTPWSVCDTVVLPKPPVPHESTDRFDSGGEKACLLHPLIGEELITFVLFDQDVHLLVLILVALIFEDGWRSSELFGEFRIFGQTEWIFHSELGWVFEMPDEERGLWLWQGEMGWLWTQYGAWPYLWRDEVSGWVYFLKKQEGKTFFYDYTKFDYLILPYPQMGFPYK